MNYRHTEAPKMHIFITLREWREATNEQRREWSAVGALIRD